MNERRSIWLGGGMRAANAIVGVLLSGAAVAILWTLESLADWRALAAALVLFALGGDALVSAARDRRSLLSRIGPLP